MEDQGENKYLNPGGRPSLSGDELLAYRLVTRVNEGDNKAIKRDFKLWQSGRTGRIADYLREIILNRNKQGISVGKSDVNTDRIIELTQTLHNIRQHLQHLDTCYSQIVQRINSIEDAGKLFDEVQISKATIDEIGPLIVQINTLVKSQTEAVFQK